VGWLTHTWYEKILDYQQVRPESESEMLFLNKRGKPISVNGIQYRMRAYCQQANLSLTCHQLRHTFARRLANERMPIESISKLLGHSQIETTQRYTAGANPDLQAEFEQAMNQMVDESADPVPVSQTPRPPRQYHPPDVEQLDIALARYAEFPSWLQTMLDKDLRRRWYEWKSHMAVDNAHHVSRRLRAIWRWMLQTFDISGWDDLKRTHLEQWLDHELERGLASSTVSRNLVQLQSFLRFVLDHDIPLSANLFRVTRPTPSQPLPKHLDEASYQLILETMMLQTADLDDCILHRTWFLTLAQTGIRLSELLDLRVSDLDLPSSRLFIHETKNDEGRVVFLTPALVHHLQSYLTWRPSASTDHLFLTLLGSPLTPWFIQTRCRRWGATCNITFSPHRLRHTFATRLINYGLPLESIRSLLGHKTLAVTQQYARLHDDTIRLQFEQASACFEAIPIPNWPTPLDEHHPSPLESTQCNPPLEPLPL